MKDRKLEFIIPISYLLLLIVYMIIVILVIDNNTQGHSEIYGLIYSISFFVTHPFYSFLLGFLIIIPLPLLVIAIVQKKKRSNYWFLHLNNH